MKRLEGEYKKMKRFSDVKFQKCTAKTRHLIIWLKISLANRKHLANHLSKKLKKTKALLVYLVSSAQTKQGFTLIK